MVEPAVKKPVSADFSNIGQRVAVKREVAERMTRCASAIEAACAPVRAQHPNSMLALGADKGGRGLAARLRACADEILRGAARLEEGGRTFDAALDEDERRLAEVKTSADNVPTDRL